MAALWMLRENVVGELLTQRPDDAIRVAEIAKHLPALDAADVDADTIAWLSGSIGRSTVLVVGRTATGEPGLHLVYLTPGSDVAHIVRNTQPGFDALDPHFEPDTLGDVLLRLGATHFAARLNPRPQHEVTAAHAADLQSDVIAGFKCTAYYKANGEPPGRLITRFQRWIESGAANGTLTGDSDAELVRCHVVPHVIKEPATKEIA